MKFEGYAHKFGDNIDTDVIIPARYLNTFDENELAKHCMEDIDSEFINKVKKGDIIIGGKNFGCGSSREHAPVAIKASGISCVIARSFARIFYRNAINVGLPIFECNVLFDESSDGDEIAVNADNGVIINKNTGKEYHSEPFPNFIQEIIKCGGEIEYIKKKVAEK